VVNVTLRVVPGDQDLMQSLPGATCEVWSIVPTYQEGHQVADRENPGEDIGYPPSHRFHEHGRTKRFARFIRANDGTVAAEFSGAHVLTPWVWFDERLVGGGFFSPWIRMDASGSEIFVHLASEAGAEWVETTGAHGPNARGGAYVRWTTGASLKNKVRNRLGYLHAVLL